MNQDLQGQKKNYLSWGQLTSHGVLYDENICFLEYTVLVLLIFGFLAYNILMGILEIHNESLLKEQ